jgi:hypothetical protein
VRSLMPAKSPSALKSVGIYVSRYGLVVTLLLIGVLKFSAGEAQGKSAFPLPDASWQTCAETCEGSSGPADWCSSRCPSAFRGNVPRVFRPGSRRSLADLGRGSCRSRS